MNRRITPEEVIQAFRGRYRACQTCSKSFLPSRGNQKHCSSCQCGYAKRYKGKAAGV